MRNQEYILKKASALIDKKNYKETKSVLLELIKEVKNIKIDARTYYLLYLAFDGLKEVKSAKKIFRKMFKN